MNFYLFCFVLVCKISKLRERFFRPSRDYFPHSHTSRARDQNSNFPLNLNIQSRQVKLFRSLTLHSVLTCRFVALVESRVIFLSNKKSSCCVYYSLLWLLIEIYILKVFKFGQNCVCFWEKSNKNLVKVQLRILVTRSKVSNKKKIMKGV